MHQWLHMLHSKNLFCLRNTTPLPVHPGELSAPASAPANFWHWCWTTYKQLVAISCGGTKNTLLVYLIGNTNLGQTNYVAVALFSSIPVICFLLSFQVWCLSWHSFLTSLPLPTSSLAVWEIFSETASSELVKLPWFSSCHHVARNSNGFNTFPEKIHILLIYLYPLSEQGTKNCSMLQELN